MNKNKPRTQIQVLRDEILSWGTRALAAEKKLAVSRDWELLLRAMCWGKAVFWKHPTPQIEVYIGCGCKEFNVARAESGIPILDDELRTALEKALEE